MHRFALKMGTLVWLVLIFSIFFGTFLVAYTSEERVVRLVINRYGEAEVELMLLLLGSLVVIGGTSLLAVDTFEQFKTDLHARALREAAANIREPALE